MYVIVSGNTFLKNLEERTNFLIFCHIGSSAEKYCKSYIEREEPKIYLKLIKLYEFSIF